MRNGALSINFYLSNLMADERQRGSHEIVQSRERENRCAHKIKIYIWIMLQGKKEPTRFLQKKAVSLHGSNRLFLKSLVSLD
jgi:hypothetical protein